MARKVRVYIAASLDGYIAREDGDISWLDSVNRPGEDYGYGDFIDTIGAVIMGRKTYDKVLSFGVAFPHEGRDCYVLSRTRTGKDEHVTYFNGAIEELIDRLKKESGKDIFVDGGAEAIHVLREKGLIDSYTISIIPILLGKGIRLFKETETAIPLTLTGSKTFASGLVQLNYVPTAKKYNGKRAPKYIC